jgi:hypothetical protein
MIIFFSLAALSFAILDRHLSALMSSSTNSHHYLEYRCTRNSFFMLKPAKTASTED